MIIEINDDLFEIFKNAFSSSFFEKTNNFVIENLLIKELKENCIERFTLDELTNVESIYNFKKDIFNIFDVNEFYTFNIKNTKSLTDYYGYQYSDNLIKEIALKLKKNIPENIIYRIAGDKFFSFGEFKGKFISDEKVKVEVSHIELKPEIKKRINLFIHPETLLDFIIEVSYEKENEFFIVKERYILS